MKSSIVFAILMLVSSLGEARASDEYSGWRFNLTPALISQGEGYGFGGGLDPEVRYSFDMGVAYFSAGARVGAYYAKNLFGTMAMPTARVTIPFGSLETYGAVGMGYGWVPKISASDISEMYRAGLYYHFSRSFGIGVEATYQRIEQTNFQFLSLGSMLCFRL